MKQELTLIPPPGTLAHRIWHNEIFPTFSKASGLYTNKEKGNGVCLGSRRAPEGVFSCIKEWRPHSHSIRLLGLMFGKNVEACRTFPIFLKRAVQRLSYFSTFQCSLHERARIVMALIDSMFTFTSRASPASLGQIKDLKGLL